MDNPKPNKCELRYNPEFNKLYYICNCWYNCTECVYSSAPQGLQNLQSCKYLKDNDKITNSCTSKVAQVNAFYRFTQYISKKDNLDE